MGEYISRFLGMERFIIHLQAGSSGTVFFMLTERVKFGLEDTPSSNRGDKRRKTKMKRFLAAALATSICVTAFAGCGNNNNGSSAASASKNESSAVSTSSTASAATGETDFSTQDPYTVKLLIPGDAKTEDCKEVSEAASKILQEKYNTTLDITRVGFGSYPDQVNLMLSSGEKLDVLYNNRDIFVSAVNNGQIVPMEEYLSEYGPDLFTEIPEERWACTSLNGKKYAVPANKEIAVSWGFACVKEMADATGVDYSNIKTEDDLLPLLEAAKEKFPDVWPVVASYGGMSIMNTADDLGADIGSLEDCTNPDDTTVVNFFATDTYKDIVERRYAWTQKGLIIPDASSTSEDSSAQIAAGKGFGMFTNTKPGIEGELEKKTTKEMLVFTLTPVYTSTTRLDILWYIAHNSEKPERAVQVLNEIYTNPELENICINGIEGKHFEIKDESKGIVGYPEGVDGTNTGYPSYPWAWPNEMISYTWEGDPENIWQQTSDWNDSAVISPAMGFSWDNSSVLNQVTACKNVKSKYENALGTGSIDPATALPAFLQELEDAGVNDIIQEKQKQLDAWLASNS